MQHPRSPFSPSPPSSPQCRQVGGLTLALLAIGLPFQARSETLFEAMTLAYQTNPALKAQRADLRATNEDFVQALSAFGPQARLSGQYGYQDARVQEPASFFTPAQTTEYRASTGAVDLSLVQPLYGGGAYKAGLNGAKAEVQAGREALRQVENQLLLNVVIAYEDVRRDRLCLRIVADEETALGRTLDEIQAKQQAGALSHTDLAQSRARLLAAQAQRLQVESRLGVSTAAYVAVVGQPPGELGLEPELPGLPANVDQAFDAAEHNNPKLLQAMRVEDQSRNKVDEAKAANGPSLSLRLDAAISPSEPYLERQYDKSYSIAAVVNAPLFTSGVNRSKVRAALEQDNRARFEIESNRRDAIQAVAQGWDQMQANRQSVALYTQQAVAETAAVEGERLEERAGLRSTIELLNAELERANVEISLVQSRHDEYVARAQVLAAMGMMELRYMAAGAQIYRPERALDQVRPKVLETLTKPIRVLDGLGSVGQPSNRPLATQDSARPEVIQPGPVGEGLAPAAEAAAWGSPAAARSPSAPK